MGKISDALERRKKERSIKTEGPLKKRPEKLIIKRTEASRAKEFIQQREYGHKLVVASEPDSLDAENFKVLRAQILFVRDRERPRTIMVTSAFPGEGKTFVAANLAVSIALGIDEYVLLIDCDFRRSSLHEMLGYTNMEGMCEYLTGEKDLQDLIIRTKIDKLSMLTAGSVPPNPTELLSSNMMEGFVKEVKERYQDRFIIIDATPSQVTAETNVLARYVDGIVLVVMAQKSPRKAIQETVSNLGKEKILGVVFNGYTQADKSYHKYYKKYYKTK